MTIDTFDAVTYDVFWAQVTKLANGRLQAVLYKSDKTTPLVGTHLIDPAWAEGLRGTFTSVFDSRKFPTVSGRTAAGWLVMRTGQVPVSSDLNFSGKLLEMHNLNVVWAVKQPTFWKIFYATDTSVESLNLDKANGIPQYPTQIDPERPWSPGWFFVMSRSGSVVSSIEPRATMGYCGPRLFAATLKARNSTSTTATVVFRASNRSCEIDLTDDFSVWQNSILFPGRVTSPNVNGSLLNLKTAALESEGFLPIPYPIYENRFLLAFGNGAKYPQELG